VILTITDFTNPPSIVKNIDEFWRQYNDGRTTQLSSWDEVRRYVYATDTRFTTASRSPWKNKTTRNKLSRIRDTLVTEYVRNLLPNEDFFRWMQYEQSSKKIDQDMKLRLEEYTKAKLRSQYVKWREFVVDLLNEWVLYGNVFSSLDYIKRYRWTVDGGQELVFQGARPFRISPTQAVFNANAQTLEDTAVAWREVIPRSEFFKNRQPYYNEEIMVKLVEMDQMGTNDLQDWIKKNHQSQDGVSWLDNFNKGQIELIHYHGDVYDQQSGQYLFNQEIVIADRLFLVYAKPNTANSGVKRVFYAGWRPRPDNLWHQGPLENVVGLQYRIDHVENLKSDAVDLMSMPVILVKGAGSSERFIWRPGEQWDVPENGDVKILYPDPKILDWNNEILTYERAMEELAGVPRETAGFRTPGEKTAFEVDQLLSNADGLFEEKLMAFESQILEPMLNSFLEMNLGNLSPDELRDIFPENLLAASEENVEFLQTLLAEGRLYVIGSKHYKMRQRKVQEIMALTQIALGEGSPMAVHMSAFAVLKALETEVGIEDLGIVGFGRGLEEQASLSLKQQEVDAKMQQIQQAQGNQQNAG
jgi:hypothetical protein